MPATPDDVTAAPELTAALQITLPLHLRAVAPANAARSLPVLIGLHGFAQDAASMLAVLRRMTPPEFLLVSLQGPHTTIVPGTESSLDRKTAFHWGVSPDPKENRAMHRAALAAALEWALAQGGDPARVSLVGFSQPCSFNYRLALDPPHGHPFRALVGICGGIPGEWSGDQAPEGTAASRATSVLHVSTREDPFYAQERIAKFHERLTARFANAEHRLYDGAHRIPSAAFEDIEAFLARAG